MTRLVLTSLFLISSVIAFGQCNNLNLIVSSDQSLLCGAATGNTVTFTNASTGSRAGSSNYYWIVDGDTLGTTVGIGTWSHDFDTEGSFEVVLVAEPTTGTDCTESSTPMTIEVVPIPTASFTVVDPISCSNQSLSFNNTSTGTFSGSTYFWDFGDGNTSSNPTHTYTTTGSFDVTLTVTNGAGCTDAITQPINVGQTPVVIIDGMDSETNSMKACFTAASPKTEADVSFNNYTTGASTHSWDFGDGSATSTDEAPMHTYTSYGVFTVEYTATSAEGCSASEDLEFVFLKRPENTEINNAISLDPLESEGCVPHSLTTIQNNFDETNMGVVTYLWNFGDGTTSTSKTPTKTYTAPNHTGYTVLLTVENACGSNVGSLGTVKTYDRPTPSFTISPNTYAHCAPLMGLGITNTTPTAVHQNPAAPGAWGTKYNWDFGNGTAINTNNETTPAQDYLTQGTYTISLTAQNACGSRTVTRDIRVDSIPVISIIADNVNDCSSQTVSFENNTIDNAPGTSHHWQWTRRHENICRGWNYYGSCYSWDNGSSDYIYGSGGWQNTRDLSDKVFNFSAAIDSVPGHVRYRASNHCGTRDTTITIITHRPTHAEFQLPGWNHTPAIAPEVCVGDPFLIDDRSRGERISFAPKPDTLLVYSWDFGDGNTSNTLTGDTTYSYDTPGTKEIELTVRGYCGSRTVRRSILVKPYPTVDIVPEPEICEREIISFTNNGTAGATSYLWNFGANASPSSSSSEIPPNVRYNADGTKRIYLTTTLDGCVTRDSIDLLVNPLPDPNFSINETEFCSPLEAVFTNLTPDADSSRTYEWIYGQGDTTYNFTPDPNIVYNSAYRADSSYIAKLIVTTDKGCTDSIQRSVLIHPLPEADFDLADDVLCNNVATDITNNSVLGDQYLWFFGNGQVSIEDEPVYIYPHGQQGNFDIKLIVTSEHGCQDSLTKGVFIDEIPFANFMNDTICHGFETVFDASISVADVAWTWYFDSYDTITGTDPLIDKNPSFLFPSSGLHQTTLIVENLAGCTDTITKGVPVKLTPEADFAATDLCLLDETSFTNTTSTPTNAWEWDFGDGLGTSSANDTLYEFGAIGQYDVEFIVHNAGGCSDTVIRTIEITGIPVSNFEFRDTCANDQMLFTDQSVGNPDTYSWNFDTGIPGDNITGSTSDPGFTGDVEFAFPLHGTYDVTLRTSYSASGCYHDTTKTITIHQRTIPNFTAPAVCLNDTTQFVSTTTGAPPQTWKWLLGDPGNSISVSEDTVFAYQTPQNYTVSLITESAEGCLDTVTRNVTVNVLPVAGFFADTVCHNAFTAVSDTSQGGNSWKYIWGDSQETHSANPEPTHQYGTYDEFSVMQVVFNTFGCSDTLEQLVRVHPNPIADFNVSTACASYSTEFTDLSTAPSANLVDWHWSFGDGGGSVNDSTQHPSFIYPSNGNYTATLTVKNEFGCSHNISKPVHVREQPVADFSNNIACARNNIFFENLSTGTGLTGYIWDFGDGSPEEVATLADPDAVHSYNVGGAYPVTLIVSNNVGCIDTLVRDINVYNVPFPDFSAETVCIGTTTSFVNLTTDASGLANDYFWDFGDGNTSPSATPNYIYGVPGTYTVTLTAGNPSGCDSTIQKDIVVAEVPVADFINDTVCFGSETNFVDVSTGIPHEWIWDFGDGTIINSTDSVSHTYSSHGNYLVSLRVNGGGLNCSDQIHKIITVNEMPSAGLFVDSESCLDQGVQFQNASTIIVDSIVSYDWSMGDNTTYNQEDGSHLYSNDGNYTVQLMVTSSQGCQDSISETILVNPLPSTGLDTYGLEHCPGETLTLTAGANLDYQWSGPNSFTHTEQSFSIEKVTSVNGGYYTVMVTDANGCSEIDSVNVEILSGNKCVVVTQLVTPNADGDNDTWIIEGIDQYPNVEVNIFNRWGSLVYQNKQYANDWAGEVNKGIKIVPEGRVPPGTYFYTIQLNDGLTEVFNGFIELEY